MGAVLGDSDGRPPLHIDGGGELQPIGYELPVASAQVKSCILLAGLYAATGPTTVIEPVPTRDHTERLLRAAGARVAQGPAHRLGVAGRAARARRGRRARRHLARPRRSSSPRRCWPSRACSCAACPINPTRTGLLTVLERMGARINLFNRRTTAGGEPIADVEVHPAELVATEIEAEIVPRDGRRAAAARARGDDGARPHGRARRGRAARQGVEPARDGRRAAARDRRPRARDRRRLGDPRACRRGPRAAASTPTATTASACSARSRGSSRATACASTARPRSASRTRRSRPSSSAWRCGRGDRDRRARRAPASRRSRARSRPSSATATSTPARCTAPSRSPRCARASSSEDADGARRPRRARRDACRTTPSCAAREVDAPRLARRAPPAGARCAAPTRSARYLAEGDAVAEGRDVGAVVWPEAELKIWLDAAPERARAPARATSRATPPPRRRSPSATSATPRRRCARPTRS